MVERIHINGKYMGDHIGADVVLEGTITKLSSDGLNVELTTFDQIKINVALNEPFVDEASGIMQVFGKVQSKGILVADSYTCFPPEEPDNVEFEPADHNDLMDVLHVMDFSNIMVKSADIVVAGPDDQETVNDNEFPEEY